MKITTLAILGGTLSFIGLSSSAIASVSITYVGTIISGYDLTGEFGPPGTNWAGLPVNITYTFSPNGGIYSYSPPYALTGYGAIRNLQVPAVDTIFNIGGISHVYSANSTGGYISGFGPSTPNYYNTPLYNGDINASSGYQFGNNNAYIGHVFFNGATTQQIVPGGDFSLPATYNVAQSGNINVLNVTKSGYSSFVAQFRENIQSIIVSTTAAIKSQIVYLDFNAGLASFVTTSSVKSENNNFTYNSVGAMGFNIAGVVQEVQNIFSKYNITFVTAQPTTGLYDTVYIGGTPQTDGILSRVSSTVANFLNNGVNGVAAMIGIGNTNPSNSAVVFSGNPYFQNGNGDAELAQTIAHEVGHMLGLQHVNSFNELMQPGSSASATGISSLNVPLAGGVGFQDSDGLLECYVGLAGTGQQNCSGAIFSNAINITIKSLFSSTIYDAQLIGTGGGTDMESGNLVYSLGTIAPGSSTTIYLPSLSGAGFTLEGALTEGGSLQQFGPTQDLSGAPLTFAVSDGGSAAPEPATWSLMILGFGLIGMRLRKSNISTKCLAA